MLSTVWTTVLTITLQIHNGEAKPVSPSDLKLNLTSYSLEIGQPLRMPGRMPVPELEATTYPVSGTTIALRITSNPASVLSQEDVTTYLGNALQIAKDNDKSTLMEKVFRIEEPSIKFIFAICPPLFFDIELTWGDVVSIVSSLLDYFKESGAWVEIRFEIEDKERGPLGSGKVGKMVVDITKTTD